MIFDSQSLHDQIFNELPLHNLKKLLHQSLYGPNCFVRYSCLALRDHVVLKCLGKTETKFASSWLAQAVTSTSCHLAGLFVCWGAATD
jgi:hypothetical protein